MTNSNTSTLKPVYLVLAVIVSVIVFNWRCNGTADLSLKEMCSPENPQISMILDLPITLPDGSLQVAERTVYPAWALWQQDGIVRGCQCSIKPCVMKCCPEGRHVELGQCEYSANTSDLSVNTIAVIIENNSRRIVNVSREQFSFIERKCSYLKNTTRYELQMDGQMYDLFLEKTTDRYDVCFDFSEGYLHSKHSFYCYPPGLPTVFPYRLTCELVQIYVHYFIVAVHLITLIVFSMLPELRTGYGKSIMCYVATLFVRHVFDYWEILPFKLENVFAYYEDLSVHLWQSLIAFQMWTTFRSTRATDSKPNQNTLIIHCIIGWGFPFIIPLILHMIIGIYIIVPSTDLWLIYIDAFSNVTLFIPMVVLQFLELANLVLGFAILRALERRRQEANKLQDIETKTFNTQEIQWSSVFTKVTLVTSVDYILINILGIMGYLVIYKMRNEHKYLGQLILLMRYCLDDFKHLRGLEIFIVFICKKTVFGLLQTHVAKNKDFLINCWMNVKGQLIRKIE